MHIVVYQSKIAASRRPEVWGTFKFLSVDEKEDKSTTICTLRTSKFKYTTGSTSSMSANFYSIQPYVAQVTSIDIQTYIVHRFF